MPPLLASLPRQSRLPAQSTLNHIIDQLLSAQVQGGSEYSVLQVMPISEWGVEVATKIMQPREGHLELSLLRYPLQQASVITVAAL